MPVKKRLVMAYVVRLLCQHATQRADFLPALLLKRREAGDRGEETCGGGFCLHLPDVRGRRLGQTGRLSAVRHGVGEKSARGAQRARMLR